MSKARALEILAELAETDSDNVKDYNNAVSWQGHSIERQLHFTSHRVTHITAGLAAAIRALATEDQPPVSGEIPK